MTVSTARRMSARLRKLSTSWTRWRPRACDVVAVGGEARGFGVAEAEDGLIDVADGVEAVGRADEFDESGLLAVGVLKLVHQDVVELAAQAGAGIGMVFEQAHGELFEVGEIERAGLLFALAIETVEAAKNLDQQCRAAGRRAR